MPGHSRPRGGHTVDHTLINAVTGQVGTGINMPGHSRPRGGHTVDHTLINAVTG
jgi:hypothetical protein